MKSKKVCKCVAKLLKKENFLDTLQAAIIGKAHLDLHIQMLLGAVSFRADSFFSEAYRLSYRYGSKIKRHLQVGYLVCLVIIYFTCYETKIGLFLYCNLT